MNLLYLLPEYVNSPGGGIATFYRHFLPVLARQGHDVRVIVGSGVSAEASTSQSVVEGVGIEALSETLLLKYHAQFACYSATPGLRRHLAAAWAMREQASFGDGFDLLEATDWGLLFLPWIVEGGPPCVVQLHGSIGQVNTHDPVRGEELQGIFVKLLERAAIERSTEVQANSQMNAVFWQHQTGRDVTRILPAWKPLQTELQFASRQDRGLVVGRVQRWKGPDVLCAALQLLGARAPNIDWLGRDMPFESLDTTTGQHLRQVWPDVWGTRVKPLGQVSATQAAQLQARASFVVVPSSWDTFNFTCVEAMGAATPVICSTGAGACELIKDGENGLTFDNGSTQSLAAALDRMLTLSEQARRQIGAAGQETVIQALEPERISEQRLNAYRAAVSRNSRIEPMPDDDWLREASAPDPSSSESYAFLDQLPLKALAQYTARRMARKVGVW